ncbi:hypothetical protein EON63_18535 [archaeon]|nr:MAG: hypothetical protein EON63_18535 [archaeon]
MQDKSDAALWNLRPCRPPRDHKAVQFADSAATKGIVGMRIVYGICMCVWLCFVQMYGYVCMYVCMYLYV